jgi:hypothetical protein
VLHRIALPVVSEWCQNHPYIPVTLSPTSLYRNGDAYPQLARRAGRRMSRSVGRGGGADTMIRSQALPSATSDVSDPADHTTREARSDGENEQRQRWQVIRPEEEQAEAAGDEQSD